MSLRSRALGPPDPAGEGQRGESGDTPPREEPAKIRLPADFNPAHHAWPPEVLDGLTTVLGALPAHRCEAPAQEWVTEMAAQMNIQTLRSAARRHHISVEPHQNRVNIPLAIFETIVEVPEQPEVEEG